MIVLDANVLIAFLDDADAHHHAASDLLLGSGADALAMSSTTMAEVLVQPIEAGRADVVEDVLLALEVAELPQPHGMARRLAQLRVDTGLRLPDCCVLLAAQDAGAAVATFDQRLAAAAGRLGLRTLGETRGG